MRNSDKYVYGGNNDGYVLFMILMKNYEDHTGFQPQVKHIQKDVANLRRRGFVSLGNKGDGNFITDAGLSYYLTLYFKKKYINGELYDTNSNHMTFVNMYKNHIIEFPELFKSSINMVNNNSHINYNHEDFIGKLVHYLGLE